MLVNKKPIDVCLSVYVTLFFFVVVVRRRKRTNKENDNISLKCNVVKILIVEQSINRYKYVNKILDGFYMENYHSS